MKIYVMPKDNSAKEKAKCWFKNRMVDAKDIWENNKAEIVILAPLLIGGGVKATKTINKTINLRQEERLKDFRIYDNSLGHYWELNKKLNNNQYLEIENRKKMGEPLGNILKSMNVLK